MEEYSNTQLTSFKVWILNFLQQYQRSVDILQIIDEFDKIVHEEEGIEHFCYRMNIPSFKDLLRRNYYNLIEVDDYDNRLTLLRSGQFVLEQLLKNCRICLKVNSVNGFCLLHAVENLRNWNSFNQESLHEATCSGAPSKTGGPDIICISSSYEFNQENQCFAFKVWLLNLLSNHEVLNVGEIGTKFKKEVKNVNWLRRFNYPKLTSLLTQELSDLVIEKNNIYKMSEKGKQMLIQWITTCRICYPDKFGLCAKHALENLSQWSENKVCSSSLNKSTEKSLNGSSTVANTSQNSASIFQEPPLIVSFKVLILQILKNANSSVLNSNVKLEMEKLLEKKVDLPGMFQVNDLSELFEQKSVLKDFIYYSSNVLHLTVQGQKCLNSLIDNCFYCNKGSEGACFSHAIDALKRWKPSPKMNKNSFSSANQLNSNLPESLKSSSLSNLRGEPYKLCLALISWVINDFKDLDMKLSSVRSHFFQEIKQTEKWFSQFNVNNIEDFIKKYMGNLFSVNHNSFYKMSSEGFNVKKFFCNNCKECLKNQSVYFCGTHSKYFLSSVQISSNKPICTIDLSNDDKISKSYMPGKSNMASQSNMQEKQQHVQRLSASNNADIDRQRSSVLSNLDFPTLEESRNISSRQVPFDPMPSLLNSRSMSELHEYETLEMPKINSRDSLQLSRDHINSVAQDCIQQLAELNEHVSIPKIVSCLLNRFQVRSLNMLNTSLRRPEDIECIFKHTRDLCRINAYIQTFLCVRSVATAYELNECLKEYDYDSLHLGPFMRLPILYDYFKIPNSLKEIPHIETKDIIVILKEYLTSTKKWSGKVSLTEFLEYLCKQYNAKTAYELGIQIKSIPLAIQVLKKAQRDECFLKEKTDKQMNVIFEKEMTQYIENFRRHLTECSTNLKMIKQHLYKKPVVEVLNELLELYEIMITGLLDEKRKKVYKTQLKSFRSTFKSDEVLAHLFTLAVLCASDQSIDDVIGKIQLTLLGKSFPTNPSNTKTNQEDITKKLPSENEVFNLIKDYLEKMLEKGQLTLKHLNQIEAKIAEKFETKFESLGCGTFLECLIQQPHLIQMLDEAGCSSLGLSSSTSSGDAKHHYLPSFQEILNFIYQCDSNLTPEMLAGALCAYFGVSDVKFLNYGSINRLLKSAKPNSSVVRQPSNVIYEIAITSLPSSHLEVKRTVGLLGSKTIEDALNCLENCPLLEDLKIWSHWDLVFKPELGDMKQFIQKYGHGGKHGGIRRHPLLILEIEPGKLLKLTNDASDELFSRAACQGDVQNTCGHLVSLIALNGIQNSLALWSTRIKIALHTLYQRELEKNNSDNNPDLRICQFVKECLMLIPKRICLSVASKVFLEPLSTFGANHSKQLLMKCCSTSQEFSLLQQLGMVLVIQEWADSFNDKLVLKHHYLETEESEIKESPQELSSNEESEVEVESDSENSDDSILESISDNTTQKNENKLKNETEQEDSDALESEVTKLTEDINEEIEDLDQNKVIIDTIRKEEFGVGLVLTGEAAALLRSHEERLGRSLDRLSKDLYSKDTHFVLELIQNADDNAYPDEYFKKESIAEPAIKFILQSDRIIILNNECGFLEKHVRAVCDVGKTTKGKHLAGYIGQKGIGFKSVFRISDKPEIHSAGFHFCFDVNSGPMGYIMPHWIKDYDPQDGWNTKIILPLKTEFQNTMTQRTLLAQFQDIHSSLLIFLHRLRHITIENQIDNTIMEMTRKDLMSNLIELITLENKCQWLVIRKLLDASKISAQMKAHGGVEVEGTELALAFPLFTSEDKKINLKVLPPKQKVFAFLPLRSYGFRFILQGDFEVPSSREEIDIDSPWNQWLRNEVSMLFCDSLQSFLDHPSLTAVEAICYFLQFLPFEDEVLDFFRPVTSGIYKLLRGRPCLPVISSESNKSLEWKIPVQVVISSDPFIQEVISPDILKRTLDFYYIHPQILENVSLTLLMSLGVQKLSTSHLISIGVCLAADLKHTSVTPEVLIIICNWMVCLYRSLDDVHQEDVLDPVKTIAIIPLANGRLISVTDDNIFFPVKLDNLHEQEKRIISVIETELNVVHHQLLNCQETINRSQITKLLEKLGVKHTVPKEIISSHIIPIFKSDAWKDKSQDLLIAYVVYIKQQFSRVKHAINLDELKTAIQFKTSQGFKNAFKESIHFSKDYANPVDLAGKLPGIQWILLDRSYLKFSTFDGILEWRTFFSEFGVLDALAVKKCVITHTSKTLKSSIWSGMCDSWPSCETYIIKDYACEQFLALISQSKSTSAVFEQMAVLVELIDTNWNSQYSKMLSAEVCNSEDQVICTTQSSFGLSVKQSLWLPGEQITSVVLDNDNVKLLDRTELWLASELYKSSTEARELLHIHVPYLKATLNDSSFAKHLGVKEYIDINLIKTLLLTWCDRKSGVATMFNTSLAHMEAVYRFLWKKSTHDDLQELFMKHPIIFVPAMKSSDASDIVCGKFLTREEVFWCEPSGILSKHCTEFQTIHIRRALSDLYPDLERIFSEAASVDRLPNLNEYIIILEYIARIYRQSKIKISDVMKLYQLIYVEFIVKSSSDLSLTKIRQTLSNRKIFLTTSKLWVTLEENPMIADDKELVELFHNELDVYLLDFSRQKEGQLRDVEITEDLQKVVLSFFNVCGISKISDSVTSEFTTEFYQPCPHMQQFVHNVIPYVQTFFWNKLRDIYIKLKKSNIKEKLSLMRFIQVKKLQVVYRLQHKPRLPVVKEEKCSLINSRDLYIQEGFKENYHLICSQLVLMFIQGNPDAILQLKLFLTGLTPAVLGHCRESPDEFMENQNYKSLPEEEETWAIPLPLLHIPPVIAPVAAPIQESLPIKPFKKDTSDPNQLKCWPPPDPRRGRLSSYGKTNDDIKTSEQPTWPRAPTPPPDYNSSAQNTSDTQSHTSDKSDILSHRVSEFKENIPSQTVDHSVRNSPSPNSSKRKRQMENDNEENKMPRVSSSEQFSRSGSKEDDSNSRGNWKNTQPLKASSHPNEHHDFPHQYQRNFPEHDDSIVIFDEQEGSNYMKIYHPRPKNRKYPLTDVEVEFEELATGKKLEVPKTFESNGLEDRLSIGRYGEALVNDFLRSSFYYPGSNFRVSWIDWVNETTESEYPYDLKVILENGTEIFIEVKTTKSNHKEVFEISVQEVQFAQAQKDCYHLFRVFNAGNQDKVRLVFLKNLASKLEYHSVKLCMVI